MHNSIRRTLLSIALSFAFASVVAISPSLAADPSDAIGQFRVGYLYERGDGVTKDYKEAMRLYLLSAGQGNAVAEFRVGYLYEKGWGVTQDDVQAMQWYEKAAAAGNQPATSRLAVLKIKHSQH